MQYLEIISKYEKIVCKYWLAGIPASSIPELLQDCLQDQQYFNTRVTTDAGLIQTRIQLYESGAVDIRVILGFPGSVLLY